MRKNPDTESIRTVYLAEADREALHAIARMQHTSASALVRGFLDDFLHDELVPVKEKPRKTTIWIKPEFWEEVRTKADTDGFAIGEIIRAGIDRLSTRR